VLEEERALPQAPVSCNSIAVCASTVGLVRQLRNQRTSKEHQKIDVVCETTTLLYLSENSVVMTS